MVVSASIGDNPEGMSLKNIIVGLLTLFTLFFFFFGFFGFIRITQSIFQSQYFLSRKLVKAINARQFSKVQQFVMNCPNCINKYPSLFSKERNLRKKRKFRYPLTEACYTDDLELIELLLSNGADPNCNDGLTPLSVVYTKKQRHWYEMSRLLIMYHASLEYTTEYSEGKSSILMDIVQDYRAIQEYDYEEEKVVKAFQYALENCDHSNINWAKVLQYSVSYDRIEIVKFLLDENYCDVNDNSVGITALMFAARDSTPEMIQLLLNYGADKNCKSNEGKTAYDYAVEFDRKDNIPLLEN